MSRFAFAIALVLAGCPRRDPPIAALATDGEVRDATAVDKSGLPRVRTLTDIATHHGARVIVEGTYEVDPLASKGKGAHLTWLVLDDGTRISRAYGAVPDELGYVGRRVEATGTITSGPPDSKLQALSAPHLALEELTLIGGARVPPVASIPAPPVVSATPSLGARVDRWVQIVGTLTTVSAEATVTLGDGGVVRVERIPEATWRPLLGGTVTVTGRLALEKGAGAFGLDLVMRGPTAICAGAVLRCGM